MDDPINDEVHQVPSISAFSGRRIPLIGLIGLCCIGFFITDVVTPRCREPIATFLCLGVVTAQLTVICVWGTLVRGTFLVRLPWTILLLVISWCGFAWGVGPQSAPFSTNVKVTIGLMWLFGFITSFVPLKIAAMGFGWQIVQNAGDGNARSHRTRYSIKDLMVGTMLIALSLGIMRVMLNVNQINMIETVQEGFIREPVVWIVLAIYGAISLLVKLPCIWISLGEKRERVSIWIGVWMLYCLVLSIIEIVILQLTFGSPTSYVPVELCVAIILANLTMGGTMLTVFLALRGLGYRLERSLRKQNTPQTAAGIGLE